MHSSGTLVENPSKSSSPCLGIMFSEPYMLNQPPPSAWGCIEYSVERHSRKRGCRKEGRKEWDGNIAPNNAAMQFSRIFPPSPRNTTPLATYAPFTSSTLLSVVHGSKFLHTNCFHMEMITVSRWFEWRKSHGIEDGSGWMRGLGKKKSWFHPCSLNTLNCAPPFAKAPPLWQWFGKAWCMVLKWRVKMYSWDAQCSMERSHVNKLPSIAFF